METHAQHLHHAPGKKFKHYFYEFLMLFIAVFCGFLAENYREQIVEQKREKQYMKSLVQDLKNDTIMLNQTIAFCDYLRCGLDTLKNTLYDTEHVKNNAFTIYRLNYTYCRLVGVEFNDQTTTQLRNAGGMQVIKNQEIANAISNYWNGIKSLEMISDNYKTSMFQNAETSFGIFNRKYVISNKLDTETQHSIMEINPDAKLMTVDENTLVHYGNQIASLEARLTMFLPVRMKQQKEAAANLIALIQKEYHFE